MIEKWQTANKTTGRLESTEQNIAQYVQGTLENNALVSKHISISGDKIVIQYLEGQHVPPQIMCMHK